MAGILSRRRFLAAGAVGTAGTILAACGATPTPQVVEKVVEKEVTKVVAGTPQVVKETVVVKETQVVQNVVTATPVGGAGATVNVFDYDPTGTDAWVQADAAFEVYFNGKYPNIKVKRDQAPWTGFTEKLLTSIAGGTKYDVIYGYWEWLPQFIENKVVGPLDDVLASDTEVKPSDFFDYAKEIVDGKTYGLAWFISGWLHWYNKTKVTEAKYEDLKEMNKAGKWNYDAWYKFAKDFSKDEGSVRTFGYDMSSTRSVTCYCMLAWANGTDYWDEGFTKSTMDSKENVETWKWLQQFYKENLAPKPGQGGTGEQAIGYTNGRVMGTMAGQWYTRSIVQEKAPELFDIGMVPFPKGTKGQYSIAALNSFYFSAKPQYPEAAWTWYKERSFSDAASKIYAPIGGGRFPSRKQTAPAVLYSWEDTEVYEAIRPSMKAYRTSPKEAEFNTLYQAAWDEMVLATRPIDEILGQLAKEATNLVK